VVARLRGECQDWFAQAEIFVGFRRNLMVAIGSLEKKQAVGVGALFERLAVRDMRLKRDEVCYVVLLKKAAIEIFSAGCAKCNL